LTTKPLGGGQRLSGKQNVLQQRKIRPNLHNPRQGEGRIKSGAVASNVPKGGKVLKPPAKRKMVGRLAFEKTTRKRGGGAEGEINMEKLLRSISAIPNALMKKTNGDLNNFRDRHDFNLGGTTPLLLKSLKREVSQTTKRRGKKTQSETRNLVLHTGEGRPKLFPQWGGSIRVRGGTWRKIQRWNKAVLQI